MSGCLAKARRLGNLLQHLRLRCPRCPSGLCRQELRVALPPKLCVVEQSLACRLLLESEADHVFLLLGCFDASVRSHQEAFSLLVVFSLLA